MPNKFFILLGSSKPGNSIKILSDLISFKTVSGEDKTLLIDYCDDIGLDKIDTAECYGTNPPVEKMLGNALSKKRDKFFIATCFLLGNTKLIKVPRKIAIFIVNFLGKTDMITENIFIE